MIRKIYLFIIFITILSLYTITNNYISPVINNLKLYTNHSSTNLDPCDINDYDINNYKRSITFCGYKFKVKDSSLSSTGRLGPGNNIFSDDNDFYIDKEGRLVLTLKKQDHVWSATEVISEDNFGYGKYIFRLNSRVDNLDKNVTFSPFLYHDDNNEIDIEFSNFLDSNTHFIVQPGQNKGNLYKYSSALDGSYTSYIIDYQPNYILFQSYNGHDIYNEENLIEEWKYTGKDIPLPNNMRLHFNLYLNNNEPPSDNKNVKIIVNDFKYIK